MKTFFAAYLPALSVPQAGKMLSWRGSGRKGSWLNRGYFTFIKTKPVNVGFSRLLINQCIDPLLWYRRPERNVDSSSSFNFNVKN